jgi:hypothetical protein
LLKPWQSFRITLYYQF